MAQRRRPALRRRRRGLDAVRRVSLARLRVGFLVIAMVVSVFAARLFQLQGVDAATYAERARQVGAVSEILPATRGSITDRNGVPLAESLDGLMVVADPTKTRDDAAEIARIVARRLDVDYIDTLERLRTDGTRFRYLARRVPSTIARGLVADLEDAGYKGIDTRRDPVRTYPGGDVAANLVGFTNEVGDAGDGAELRFDALLSGTDGSATYDMGGGKRIPLGDNSLVPPRDGQDLTLTIDRDVQFYAQRVLREAVEDAGATSGAVVVMDSRTGELIALADHPTFDAGRYREYPKTDLGSRALRGAYEPGSVLKVLTAAALIDAGKVTPQTQLVVPGSITSSDRTISDYFDHDRIRLTLTGVLAKSSNVGTVLAARLMGARKLHRYLEDFGLGTRSGLGVAGEARGTLSDWRTWSQINRDNIVFGQGVAVNAVQMAAAVNAIANDGVYVQPSLVKGRARTNDGRVVGSAVAAERRVVTEEAAHQTRLMMEMVTDPDEGTAPAARIPGYRVAGKTGTAQRVDPDCACYGDSFTVSFAGFAPADDPRFLVYVVVHEPSDSLGGGARGGPVFASVMSYLLQRYAVPPTGSSPARLPVEW